MKSKIKTKHGAQSGASLPPRTGSAHLSYGDCCRIANAIGLSLGEYTSRDDDSRGLAFTVGGGQLKNGHDAEPWIAMMNGWPVEDIADEALKRKAVKKVGRWTWEWVKPLNYQAEPKHPR